MEEIKQDSELVVGEVQKQETQIVKRKKSNLWKKGQSGNPHGRPKKELAITTLAKEMLSERANGNLTKARELMNVLYEIGAGIIPDVKPADRVKAIQELNDRAFGKAKQQIDIDNTISFTVSESAWGESIEGEAEDVEELEEEDYEEDSIEVQTPEDSS